MGRKTGKSIFVPEESSGLCLDPFDHHGGLGFRLSRCSRQESRDCTRRGNVLPKSNADRAKCNAARRSGSKRGSGAWGALQGHCVPRPRPSLPVLPGCPEKMLLPSVFSVPNAYLPELGTDLVTALASLNMNDLPHLVLKVVASRDEVGYV